MIPKTPFFHHKSLPLNMLPAQKRKGTSFISRLAALRIQLYIFLTLFFAHLILLTFIPPYRLKLLIHHLLHNTVDFHRRHSHKPAEMDQADDLIVKLLTDLGGGPPPLTYSVVGAVVC